MNKNLLVGIITVIAPASSMASVHSAYYKADFSSGTLPSTLKSENINSLLPEEKYYRHGFTADGWTVDVVGSKYAAISPTHTLSEEASCNRLTTPSFLVESEDAIVRWAARSLISDCKESYKVMVSEDGSEEFNTILSIDAEDSEWTYRVVSLKGYEGKNIKVIFECNSINKYMLALSDIFIGEAGDDKLFAIDETIKFPAVEDAYVSGTIRNIGRTYPNAGIQVRMGDIAVANEMIGDFKTGNEINFSFPVDAVKDTKNSYAVEVVDGDGNTVTAFTGILFPSDMARNQMIDEGTGMWCNNCPNAVIQLEDLRVKFPNQIITIATHANDKFAEMDYWNDIKFYAIPYYKSNRQNATSDIKRLTDNLYIPTTASIEIEECYYNFDIDTIEVDVSALFSENKVNEEDNLRIGYVVTGDFHSDSQDSGIYQQNGILLASGVQYYYLPTIIQADLVWLHDVTLTSATAFTGFAKSLPQGEISADSPSKYSFTIPQNDLMQEAYKLNVVAFILDTKTGDILNSAESEVALQQGVKEIVEEDDVTIRQFNDGFTVSCASLGDRFSATLYSIDGNVIAKTEGDNLSGATLPFNDVSSIYILKLENEGKIITKKLIR